MADQVPTAKMTPQWVMAYLGSKAIEHFQPVSEAAMVEREARDAESKELFKEPLLDMLLRQQVNEIAERVFAAHRLNGQQSKTTVMDPIDCSPDCFCQKAAAPARLIAERVYGRHQLHRQQTEVIILFDDEACLNMDRREFRQLISERLNAAGDALMAAWDELHREGS